MSGRNSTHRTQAADDGPGRVNGRADAAFSVGWTHRLRFTREAFSPRNPTLADLLTGIDDRPARAVVCLDSGLVAARPDLPGLVRAWFEARGDAAELAADPVVLTGGEAAKNDWSTYRRATEVIHEAGICRRSYVLAVGGGAMLDAVGFAAATAHRGVRLVRLPSTTLAQDDAGVGVKNGINAFGKKNFLGAFAPPWAVVNDIALLASLSDRDFRAGFSEAVKVGLLKDPALIERIERDAAAIRARDLAVAEPVIHRSAELHLRHITSGGDAFETTTARPLDFGHWAAHRLESLSNHELRHGEAVAIGLALDTTYAAVKGWLPRADAARVARCLRSLGFALHHPAMEPVDDLIAGLEEFREHLGGRLTIPMIRAIGEPFEVHEMDSATIARAVEILAADHAASLA